MRLTQYKDVNKVLHSFTKGIQKIFNDNLIGVYLTGSLSYGDFNPGSSDIDLVVILKQTVSPEKLKKVKLLHKLIERENPKWQKRIECSYVPIGWLKNILPPKKPRPYYGEGKLYPKAPYGNEWLINNYYLYKSGIPLFGPDFKTLIMPVSMADVRQASIRDLFTEWQPKISNPEYLSNSHYQSYMVLNLCRILFTVMRHALASKKTSAAWVMKKYPQWRDLIQKAQQWHYGMKINKQFEVKYFIKFIIIKIKFTSTDIIAE